ncbi:hypothetical protein LTR66_002914 [Elasticomyces elasticus]|nr:hypothetical protein LTR66_002914 [Elasticomyces elasticus]
MKAARDRSGAQNELKPSSTDRKRKRPQHQPSSQDSLNLGKQQTIQDSFSSQQKPTTGASESLNLSPNSKRLRPDHSLTSDRTQRASTPRPPEEMYTFASKATNGNVVDLTSSPPSKRRLSGVRPGQQNFNPHLGAKKLVVKNLRTPSSWDPNKYFEQIWSQLDAALNTIFEYGSVTASMEDLYRGVENLCRQGKAKEVNERLYERMRHFVSGPLKEELMIRKVEENVDMLRAVLGAWKKWNDQVTLIRCIFYYMDRSYLLQTSKSSLYDIAVTLFRDLVFNSTAVKDRVVDGACDLIAADRMEQDLDQATFRQAIGIFHDLATYTSSFEPRMLGISQGYIAGWAERTSEESSLSDYVRASVDIMRREMDRCEMFNLDSTTRRDLLALLEEHIIQRKGEYLTSQGDVGALLEDNRVDELEQLYSLLQRRRLGTKLRPAFETWINNTGTNIIFDEQGQDQMVVRLLGLKRRLDNIWRVSFHRNEDLGHGLRESFEAFINKTKKGSATHGTDNSKPGEMIAKYVDQLLRGGAKAIPSTYTASNKLTTAEEEDNEEHAVDEDAEVNIQLDQVLDLFRFVHGKAVFEAFYKKDLARRLLMGRSASADAERSMLSRLKTECGAAFTQNLEQMFKDVELAREELASYKSRQEERQEKTQIDLSVNILSAAAWPTYPDISVRIPADIKNTIDGYEAHYQSKHSGRKLDWKHSLAHCQMKARFAKGSKELVVSSFQAIVLLLFNGLDKDEQLSYEHIKAESGLTDAEVIRTLQSLACAKLRPLTKHPRGRDVASTDSFSVNLAFTHEKYRVKINQVQLKETKEENKETHERVAADRNFECQAAIVRIMKSRKTIGHSELVAEVIKATRSRGVLAMADIKRNIDRLIEKDYMERDEGNTYSYVA